MWFVSGLVLNVDSSGAFVCDYIGGACIMLRACDVEKLGLIPECYFLFFEAVSYTHLDMQYFTPCWEQRGDINHEVSNRKPTEKPENYELMLRLAETLAEGLPRCV